MRAARQPDVLEVIPSARRLVHSLRDVGYDFVTAVADLVDNSVAAGASQVWITLAFRGPDSALVIEDDGRGMSGAEITEAMRFGTQRTYETDDLGKFGLGLKTASLAQCRRLTVASRTSTGRRHVEVRTLDLDHVDVTDRWEILRVSAADRPDDIAGALVERPGTVVLWEKLDRILSYRDPWGGRANTKLRSLVENLDLHLGMVFHRFLTGGGSRGRHLSITINGTPVEAWDPFVSGEKRVEVLPVQEFEIGAGDGRGLVRFRPYVLPTQHSFSSDAAWRRAAGPRSWNRQQGFYIYRGDRVIQGGGWSWMRSPDEHTKLARAAIEFWPELDSAFEVNVAKTRVRLPDDLRTLLSQPLGDLTRRANTVYRSGAGTKAQSPRAARPPAPTRSTSAAPPAAPAATPTEDSDGHARAQAAPANGGRAGGRPAGGSATAGRGAVREALVAAAAAIGEQDGLRRISERLCQDNPEVARELGW